MIYSLFIWFVILFFVSFMLSKKDIMAPAVVTSGIWVFILSMCFLLDYDFPPLKVQVLSSLFLWVTGFAVASLAMQSLRFGEPAIAGREPNKLIRDVYFLLSVATVPLLAHFAYDAIQTGPTGSWATDLRSAAVGDTEKYTKPYGGIYLILWKVTYALELCLFSRKNKWRVYLLGLMCLASGVVLMAKIVFLEFAIITLVILWCRGKIKMRHILVAVSILFVSFVVMQQIRNGMSTDGDARNDFFVLYIIGHLWAFDTLDPNSAVHFGENVFRFFYAIPYKLGFSNIKPINPLLPWIEEPLSTNTYTGMYPFFVDFGYKGVAAFSLLYGSLFGWLYKKKNGCDGNLFILLYALLFSVVVMQYVAEVFLTNFATHMYEIILSLLPFAFTVRKREK